ncbi:MAG: hypothetical protein EOP53_00495 [Sphingobacteriales bacterium]|nr:MAG: hypothetical protein EOP53_00495 [Sphingobacteriales bacterium]
MRSRFPYMPMLKNALLLALFVFSAIAKVFAQQEPRLGIAIKPIIPSGLFNNEADVIRRGNTQFAINPQVGYSAGVALRQDLPYLLSLETGIYYIRRIYELNITEGENTTSNKFRFVNYEIPVTGLIYIRLGKNTYLNNAFGLSFDFFPNSVYTENEYYQQKAERTYWVLPALTADVGGEYRTEKNGNFYIGASYHRMLINMAKTLILYEKGAVKESVTTPLSGNYFALNFRYYFPTNRTAPIDFN